MRPLSLPLYFLRNLRRVLPVLAIITLAVIGVSLIAVVGNSQFSSYDTAWGTPFKNFAFIRATSKPVDPALLQAIRDQSDVERVEPATMTLIRFPSLLGSISTPMFAIDPSNFDWFMQQSHLTLVEGRLPAPGKAEVVVHQDIMRARKLAVGDVIGTVVDDREYLPGKWTIVGVVNGPGAIGFLPLSVFQAQTLPNVQPGQTVPATDFLVVPKAGQMPSLDAYIRGLPRTAFSHDTYTSQNTILQTEYNSAKLVIWIIDVVSVVVLSLATGLLNSIYFTQRMHEYGTLAAIGYTIRFLIRRTLGEAMTMTITGWILGLGAAELFIIGIRAVLFTPRGYGLSPLDAQAVVYTLPIPVLVAAFSLFTVFRQFGRLDPVTIVEGRD
ncbi:MAG TPA: ABC transporter permease [Thermomicrobiaceae bacterium]|nr:ABC transporter permease [Thermomicrobiaceae bacterium]